jgi:hypothetical protein
MRIPVPWLSSVRPVGPLDRLAVERAGEESSLTVLVNDNSRPLLAQTDGDFEAILGGDCYCIYGLAWRRQWPAGQHYAVLRARLFRLRSLNRAPLAQNAPNRRTPHSACRLVQRELARSQRDALRQRPTAISEKRQRRHCFARRIGADSAPGSPLPLGASLRGR